MASTPPTPLSTAVTSHSEIPPWKIELIQRKKKLSALSPTQRTIMQYDINNDSNSGKLQIALNNQCKSSFLRLKR